MARGTGQARAAVLVERVMVLLLESLRGAGGSGAQGLRQLPVVDGAAVPRHPGLRREGVAGLRQLPLKPAGEARGTAEEWGSHPNQNWGAPTAGWDGSTEQRGSSHGDPEAPSPSKR